MAKLTAEERRKLPASAFVFPGSREYPIHDWGHAQAAIKDSGGKAAHAKVMAAVRRKYPAHFSGMRGNE